MTAARLNDGEAIRVIRLDWPDERRRGCPGARRFSDISGESGSVHNGLFDFGGIKNRPVGM